MATTRKLMKTRKSSTKKAAAAAVDNGRHHPRRQQWPWSELPPFLQINYLRFTKCHVNSTSPPGITKSWLPSTARCATAAAAAHQRPQLYHVVTTDSSLNPSIPNPRNNHFLGDSSIVEAVYEIPDASYWCFLKSDQTVRIHPPPTTPFERYNYLGPPLQMNGVLSPNAPTSGLMVRYTVYRNTGRNYVYWSANVLIRHECTTPDPFAAKKKASEFTGVVQCGGKFYATSLQGAVVVMQVNDDRLRITGVSAIRAVPWVRCRFFKEYLVEMKGEILMVFLIHERSVAVVDGVEVFRLDFGKLDWIKVERLEGKTLFLNWSSIWVDSEEFGCRDDRVYFTSSGSDQNKWWMYDMKSGCISSACN